MLCRSSSSVASTGGTRRGPVRRNQIRWSFHRQAAAQLPRRGEVHPPSWQVPQSNDAFLEGHPPNKKAGKKLEDKLEQKWRRGVERKVWHWNKETRGFIRSCNSLIMIWMSKVVQTLILGEENLHLPYHKSTPVCFEFLFFGPWESVVFSLKLRFQGMWLSHWDCDVEPVIIIWVT